MCSADDWNRYPPAAPSESSASPEPRTGSLTYVDKVTGEPCPSNGLSLCTIPFGAHRHVDARSWQPPSASPEPRCGQSERDHFEKDGVRHHAVPDYSTGEPNKVRAVPCPSPPASSRHSDGEALAAEQHWHYDRPYKGARQPGESHYECEPVDRRRPAPPGDGAAEREALIERARAWFEKELTYEAFMRLDDTELAASLVAALAPARLSGEGTRDA